MIPYERASQEEQKDTNFSIIAPSSEELRDNHCPLLHIYYCVVMEAHYDSAAVVLVVSCNDE